MQILQPPLSRPPGHLQLLAEGAGKLVSLAAATGNGILRVRWMSMAWLATMPISGHQKPGLVVVGSPHSFSVCEATDKGSIGLMVSVAFAEPDSFCGLLWGRQGC